MKTVFTLQLLALTPLVLASQPGVPAPIPVPLRPLKFGQLNFLHTTDTHGWHAGHLGEASYAGDWGDYIDFADRLRERLEADGKDLLVVDTGDRVEGNGLYDSSEPKGLYTYPIFTQQRMDIITIGNHELYQKIASESDYKYMVGPYHNSYTVSNLDIVDPITNNTVPFAQKFTKIKTKMQGIRIMVFGLIFDFTSAGKNCIVTPVEDMVKQSWFQGAIRDPDVDLFVVIGHVQARTPEGTPGEFKYIFDAIRAARGYLPIHFFGGHLHIRDYTKFDNNAYTLASGQMFETIGFASMEGIVPGKVYYPSYFRRYIDNNLWSMYSHSGTDKDTFHSDKGRNVSKLITDSRHKLKLDELYGCSPSDLYMSRVPYGDPGSIYTWLNTSVFPTAIADPSRAGKSRVVLANTGSIRYDVFKGAFTKDWTYIISPFISRMKYIKDVPTAQALKVVGYLNSIGPIFVTNEDGTSEFVSSELLKPPHTRGRNEAFTPDPETFMSTHHGADYQQHLTAPLKVVPGYTTVDMAGTDGDDTIHSPIPYVPPPQVIQTYVPSSSSPDKVDLIFNEFLLKFLLNATASVGLSYTSADATPYMDGQTMTDFIVNWIQKNWKKDCSLSTAADQPQEEL